MDRPAGVIPPSEYVLKKYGLTVDGWWAILECQGNVCPICKKLPTTGRMVVDHDHVRGWKKMPDEKRAQHVRGVCCWWCNHTHLGRGITIEKAQAVVTYLQRYQQGAPAGANAA
jgi:hypothetical protein